MEVASGTTANAVNLPDRLERQLIDVEKHLLPVLREAARSGTLDEAENDLHQGLARAEEELNAWAIDAIDLGRNDGERQAWSTLLTQARKRLSDLRQRANRNLFEARKQEQMEMHQRQQRDRLAAYSATDGGGVKKDDRTALFAAMSTSEEERRRRREERAQDQTADEQLMTASGDVTAALQRAVQLMSNELEKSSYSAQLLDESSVAVQQATVQYTSFSSLVASSRKLIASMERADFVDACFLLLSFLFFVGCILYIVKVRVWDRGVGVISFFLRFLGFASSRSPADVREKLAMAKQAAALEAARARSSTSSRLAAETIKTALSVSAAASASAFSASASSAASSASAALQSSSALAASVASQASSAALFSSSPKSVPTSTATVIPSTLDLVTEDESEQMNEASSEPLASSSSMEDAAFTDSEAFEVGSDQEMSQILESFQDSRAEEINLESKTNGIVIDGEADLDSAETLHTNHQQQSHPIVETPSHLHDEL